MTNNRDARKNMVDCQLATNGVTDSLTLELFGSLPREAFLPDSYKDRAYVDEDLVMDDGRVLMEPLVHARMVQALRDGRDDGARVLMIGDATGYGAALLRGLTPATFSVMGPTTLTAAQAAWSGLGIAGITPVGDDLVQYAPYDGIMLMGAVAYVPEDVLALLAPGGRLVTVLRQQADAVGRITVIERDQAHNYSAQTLQDAATPYIDGLAPPPLFKFG